MICSQTVLRLECEEDEAMYEAMGIKHLPGGRGSPVIICVGKGEPVGRGSRSCHKGATPATDGALEEKNVFKA